MSSWIDLTVLPAALYTIIIYSEFPPYVKAAIKLDKVTALHLPWLRPDQERLRKKMLIIDYLDTPENRARVDAIRAAWKQKTGDQSVMRVTEPADVSF